MSAIGARNAARTDKHAMFLHRLQCKRPPCRCGGPAFVGGLSHHRPGTRYCDQHPRGALDQALRGVTDPDEQLQILADWAVDTPGIPCDPDQIPF
jgi:hypothetical protein